MRHVAGRFCLLVKVISDLSVGRSPFGHTWTGDGVVCAPWIRSKTLHRLWPHVPRKSAKRPWGVLRCCGHTSTTVSLCLRLHVMPGSHSAPFSVGLPDTAPPGWLVWSEPHDPIQAIARSLRHSWR